MNEITPISQNPKNAEVLYEILGKAIKDERKTIQEAINIAVSQGFEEEKAKYIADLISNAKNNVIKYNGNVLKFLYIATGIFVLLATFGFSFYLAYNSHEFEKTGKTDVYIPIWAVLFGIGLIAKGILTKGEKYEVK